MPVSRRFLIAPPLARLVHKEFAPARLTEGHFAPHAERHTHVRLDSRQASLVLTTLGAHPETAEEITHLPSVHAEALLNVCPGTLVIERSAVPLGTMHAFVDRFILPGPMDLVPVDFATSVEAKKVPASRLVRPGRSADDSFSNQEIALSGLPPVQDAGVSNIAGKLSSMLWRGHPSRRKAPRPLHTINSRDMRRSLRCLPSISTSPTTGMRAMKIWRP